MDENFGQAYLDDCEDWRTRYENAIEEMEKDYMKSIVEFLKFSQTARLSINNNTWVIWDEDKDAWVVYEYSGRKAYPKLETASEEELVKYLRAGAIRDILNEE